tara:strand:+ start:337 stop:1776 length:1440 start_codon:yes stop_codon:yes gene_type:complete
LPRAGNSASVRSIKTRRSTHNRAGFTLPEVLTALAILAMVMGVVYSSWSALTTATTTSTAAVEGAQRERMALTAVSDTLASVVWYESQTESSLELEQEGEFSRLKVIARVPPGFWGNRELAAHPLRRIEFYCEENDSGDRQLVMAQQPVLASTNTTPALRTILLPRVETFQLTLYTPSSPRSLAANNPTQKNLRPPIPPTAPAKPSPPTTKRPTKPSDPAPLPPVPVERPPLPKMARMLVAANEAFTRTRAMPIYASRASHAFGPPAIGRIVVVPEGKFGEAGFDTSDTGPSPRTIFIIDKSGSMRGPRLAMAKEALLKTLNQMQQTTGPDGELPKFYIYFFNNGSSPMPSSAMLETSALNIQRMTGWVNEQEARGGTRPTEAIKSAFSLEPTDIYLLTDGNFSSFSRRNDEPSVQQLIGNLNQEKNVKVHTLAIGEHLRGREGETALMLIAKENGGSYTYIGEGDLGAQPAPAPPPKK